MLLPTPHLYLCPLYSVWGFMSVYPIKLFGCICEELSEQSANLLCFETENLALEKQIILSHNLKFDGTGFKDNNYLQSLLPKAVCGKRWYTWYAACLRVWNLNFGDIKYISHALQLCTPFLQSHKHLASIFCIFDLKIKDILLISTCSLNSIQTFISINWAINSVVWPISRCKVKKVKVQQKCTKVPFCY